MYHSKDLSYYFLLTCLRFSRWCDAQRDFVKLTFDIWQKRCAIRRIDNKKLGGVSDEEARVEYRKRLDMTITMQKECEILLERRRRAWHKLWTREK